MLRVQIRPVADDPALLEELRAGLAGELRRIPGLEAIAPERSGPPPNGAKGDAVLLGSLIASGTLSTATLTAATRVTLAWLNRAKARKVEVSYRGHRLVLEAASASRQRAVTEAWLALVADSPEGGEGGEPQPGTDG